MFERVDVLVTLALALASTALSACGEAPPDFIEPSPEAPRSFASGDLELHWSFQDRDGSTILDLSGNGRHGTIQGATAVPSPWGEALSFDGIDDMISFIGPRDPNDYGGATSGAMTISARVRVSDASRVNSLCVGCGPMSSFAIGTESLGERAHATLRNVIIGGNTWPLSTDGSIEDDTWTNVTMVVEAGVGTTYYLDCEHDSFSANTDMGLHDYGYSAVGQGSAPDRWLHGEVDDLRIWSRALTSAEIEAAVCDAPVELPCNGAPEAAELDIVLPDAPGDYPVPACADPGVVCVTPSTFATAYDPAADTVVFGEGTYTTADIGADYLAIEGQTLLAGTQGTAVLQFGIEAGGNNSPALDFTGSRIQGLNFDIDDADHTPPLPPTPGNPGGRAAIRAWGGATGLQVLDVTVHGHGVIDSGVYVSSPEGLELHRLHLRDVRRFGILAAGVAAFDTPVEISHIDIAGIDEPEVVADPTAATTGIGIMLGHRGNVSDVRVRDVRWTGIGIYGHSVDTQVEHVDIDRVGIGETTGGVGIYLDNTSHSTQLSNFCIGPNTKIGVNSEWDNRCLAPQCQTISSGFVRAFDTEVFDALIESSFFGVYFDQGTVAGEVHDVRFRNYERAGIGFYNNSVSAAAWPTYSDSASTASTNIFEVPQVPGSTCNLTYSHWNASPVCAP